MIRIIGVGSPFGDDAVGWCVIELLRNHRTQDVQLVQLDRPGAALVHWLEDMEQVVIVDAMHSDAAIGTIRQLDPRELSTCASSATTHSLGVAEALQIARAIGALPVRLKVIGIEVKQAEGKEELSANAKRAAKSVATQLLTEYPEQCFVAAKAQPPHHNLG